MSEKTDSEAAAVAEIVRKHIHPELQALKGNSGGEALETSVLLLPDGIKAVSIKGLLDEYRANPERKTGTARLETLDSLIDHVDRFKGGSSALFCSMTNRAAPSIQAVLDYHEPAAGVPHWCKHRAHYAFPLSDQWKAWQALHALNSAGTLMSQGDFAAFLEDHITDVLDPDKADEDWLEMAELLGATFATPGQLLALSKGLAVNVENRLRQHSSLQSGEAQLIFSEEHKDDNGDKLRVPGMFLVAIPVFRSGDAWTMAVRLRYRVRDGAVGWACILHRSDEVFDHAITEAAKKASEKTGVPLFYGSPEA